MFKMFLVKWYIWRYKRRIAATITLGNNLRESIFLLSKITPVLASNYTPRLGKTYYVSSRCNTIDELIKKLMYFKECVENETTINSRPEYGNLPILRVNFDDFLIDDKKIPISIEDGVTILTVLLEEVLLKISQLKETSKRHYEHYLMLIVNVGDDVLMLTSALATMAGKPNDSRRS